ncbi:MAG TPA: Ig-like domain-containing protein [Bacteroidota bacterium]|jgi:hypothetical protein
MLKLSVTTAVLLTLFALSCKGPEGPAGPAGPSGTGIESLSDPSVQPRVIYTYPPANVPGPYDDFYQLLGWYGEGDYGFYIPIYISQFQVRFNKYMDRSSVRRSIAVSSPDGGVRADTNYMISLGGDVFLINPVDTLGNRFSQWKVGETYTFGVAAGARDINGNTFQPGFSMSFTPEPFFRVRKVSPPDGASDVTPQGLYYGEIVLVFNSRVDTSVFSSIQITPDIPGDWWLSYDSTSIYRWVGQDLRNSTSYTMTVNTTAHDRAGNHLPVPFTSSFTTSPFRITHTYPANHAGNVEVRPYIAFEFAGVLDSATVRSSFRIQPAATGILNLYSNSTNFQFSLGRDLLFDSTYIVTIDTTLRSRQGLRLAEPYVLTFKTLPFEINSTYPLNHQRYVDRGTNLVVHFDAEIDTSTVRSSFSLADSAGAAVPGTLPSSGWPTNSFVFYPGLLLAPNAAYTATISTGLRSASGTALKAPYALSFTTGD